MLDSWLESSLKTFKDALAIGRTPSSIIISGDPNLRTASLAIEFAKLYLCKDKHSNEPCNACKSCLSFNNLSEGSHPDVRILISTTSLSSKDESSSDSDSADSSGLTYAYADLFNDMGTPLDGETKETKANPFNQTPTIKVAGIRQLSEWMTEGSVFGNGKVAIISNAHLMVNSAANALLKIFEEPPEHTLFILLAKNLESLPETILSRAFKIQVPQVSTNVAIEFLQQHLGSNFDKQRALCALALSNNSPLGSLNVYQSNLDLAAQDILQAINKAIDGEIEPERAVSLILSLSNSDKMLILQEFIMELIKYKAGIGLENLPLIAAHNLDSLCRIPATDLFDAYSGLTSLKFGESLIPSRAPNAVIYAWIIALRNAKNQTR